MKCILYGLHHKLLGAPRPAKESVGRGGQIFCVSTRLLVLGEALPDTWSILNTDLGVPIKFEKWEAIVRIWRPNGSCQLNGWHVCKHVGTEV